MGLFDFFKKDTKAAAKVPERDPRLDYDNPDEWNFWSMYVESLDLKDRGALFSAFEKRDDALKYDSPTVGYKGMALHNLAILSMYHLGKGQDAASYARRSLDCGDDFIRYSNEHKEEIPFGAHLESLQTAAMTAGTYEEALKFIRQGEELYGGIFETKRKEMENFRKDNPRYADYQRQTSFMYYSRVSPEQDQGDYAPAMSLLQLMLDRAEEPAYDLSYEEYVDILDDYATITVMYLMKKARVLGGSQADFAKELAFIADEPLKRIADFLPDCEPGDRPKFDNIVKTLGRLPEFRTGTHMRRFDKKELKWDCLLKK